MISSRPERSRDRRDVLARVTISRWLVLVALAVALLARLALGAGVASADAVPGTPANGKVSVAGLIVDYGDGRVAYALVPFTEPSISGFELLERSGLSLLAIEFGGLGQGICAIEETGCDLDACRARMCQTGDPDSAFWQYAQHAGNGTWSPSPLGASGSSVSDGGIDAWAWSDDPPNPGAMTLEDIAAEVGIDLAAMRSGERTSAALVTHGGDTENPAAGTREIVAAAIIGGIAIVGGLAVFRSRRQAGAP